MLRKPDFPRSGSSPVWQMPWGPIVRRQVWRLASRGGGRYEALSATLPCRGSSPGVCHQEVPPLSAQEQGDQTCDVTGECPNALLELIHSCLPGGPSWDALFPARAPGSCTRAPEGSKEGPTHQVTVWPEFGQSTLHRAQRLSSICKAPSSWQLSTRSAILSLPAEPWLYLFCKLWLLVTSLTRVAS